jgi:2-polyprenyl-3-methyl-5-hydroxy-6-metoxy-1,4-benzoquinol methylase
VTTAYTFDNSTDEAVPQLASLQAYLDPITTARIADLGLPEGARCWEIGAGAGSVAEWLAAHLDGSGQVVATDVNTSRLRHLAAYGNVTVVDHDVTTLVPPDDAGPYDLIHARLVLLHLAQRREILEALVGQLEPGGWLLLEEFDCTAPLHVYTSRSAADSELFRRVTDAVIEILVANGADMAWAQATHPAMVAAGLTDVQTTTHTQSWTGGGIGARLHAVNSRQLAAQLDALGFTPGELARFHDITADPAHSAASYLLVSTRGRRP